MPDRVSDVLNAFSKLGIRERYILVRYYGLDDRPRMSFHALARELDIGVRRVRQLRVSSIRDIAKEVDTHDKGGGAE